MTFGDLTPDKEVPLRPFVRTLISRSTELLLGNSTVALSLLQADEPAPLLRRLEVKQLKSTQALPLLPSGIFSSHTPNLRHLSLVGILLPPA